MSGSTGVGQWSIDDGLRRPGRLVPVRQSKIGYHTLSLPGEAVLRLVTTPVAARLTGLSVEKLREWTSRRSLVPADVAPTKKGSPAKFSWQTLLVLRLAVTLRDDFNLELQAHREAFAALKQLLLSHSFIALWGARIALSGDGAWTLVENGAEPPTGDAVLLRLDPHLQALSEGAAALDLGDGPRQLDLFTLPARHPRREGLAPMLSPVAERRRRSA